MVQWQIGEPMIVRKLVPSDALASSKLFSVAFEEASDLSTADSWFSPNRTWGAFDENGVLCSQMVCHELQMRFDGHWLPMGGIGGVATYPHYRRQGLARAVFEQVLPSMQTEGKVFSYLFPFSFSFYRKFGYESVCLGCRLQLPLAQLSRLPQTCSARLWEPGQPIDDFDRVYEASVADYNLAVRRGSDRWQYHLPEHPWKQRKYAYLLYGDTGEPLAYLIFAAEGGLEESHTMRVTDWAAAGPQGLKGLFAFMGSFSVTCSQLDMEIPPDLYPELMLPEMYEVRRRVSWNGMARLVDVEAALNHMRAPTGKGDLVLQVEDTLPWNQATFQVEYDEGTLQVCRTSKTPCDLHLTVQALARLLLGTFDPTERSFALLPGIEVRPGSETKLAKVFHKKPMFISDFF